MDDELTFSAGSWRVIERLGEGNTGIVYKAVNASRFNRLEAETSIFQLIRSACTTTPLSAHEQSLMVQLLLKRIQQCLAPPSDSVGALKLRKRAVNGAAVERFQREVDLIRCLEHKHMVRVVDADPNHRWLVMEYLPWGTLQERRKDFAGKVAASLSAIRGIADVVSMIHRSDHVHRDVRLRSIFVTPEHRLILGDFGGDRPCLPSVVTDTATGDPLGEMGTMPPWLFTDGECPEFRPTADVYMLGRVLYGMLSPRDTVQPAQLEEPEFDLRRLLPASPEVELVHGLLKRTIVEKETDCLPDASAFLSETDVLLRVLGPANLLSHSETMMQNDWAALETTRHHLREMAAEAYRIYAISAGVQTGRTLEIVLDGLRTPFPPLSERRGDTQDEMVQNWSPWLARSPLFRFALGLYPSAQTPRESREEPLIDAKRLPGFHASVIQLADFWNRWGRSSLNDSLPALSRISMLFKGQKSEIVLVAYLALAMAGSVSEPQPDRRWLVKLAQAWWDTP